MKIINDTPVYEPNECYFGAASYDDLTTVLITDKATWDNEKCLNDCFGSHSFENGVLPDDFSEIMEVTWETELSVDEAKQLLCDLGFVYSKEIEDIVCDYV